MLSKRVEMEAVDPVTLSICYVRLSHDRARYQWARLWIARLAPWPLCCLASAGCS